MAPVNRNITLECSICKRKTRSDNLKRHWLTKHKNFDFKVTTVVRGFLKDNDRKPFANKDLESEIVANGKLLDKKIALGEKMLKVLTDTNTKEESLSKEHKVAFDLYQIKRLCFSSDDKITLFNWQKGVLSEFVNQPTDREVVWVKGASDNEGKTWFQNYVQS